MSPFNIYKGGAEHKGIMFVGNEDFLVPFHCPVVVISRYFLEIWFGAAVLDPPVKIQLFYLIAVDQFTSPDHPVLQEVFCGNRFTEQVLMVTLRHGGPVKVPFFFRFCDITLKILSVSHKEPVLYAVGRSAVYKPFLLHFLSQFPEYIAFRSHFVSVPMGNVTAVHLKAVMMFCHRDNISGACFPKQVSPCGGVKIFGFEHGDKIFVAKIFLAAIYLLVMAEFRTSLNIHISGIPFISKGRNTVHTPMDKNTEFGISEPLGSPVL